MSSYQLFIIWTILGVPLHNLVLAELLVKIVLADNRHGLVVLPVMVHG